MDEPATNMARTDEPDTSLVADLLHTQAPEMARLPIRPIEAAGSSNWVFRLGDELAVRLPRSAEYAQDLRKEIRRLPYLAERLTTPVPRIRFAGAPSESFARPWAIVSWLPGTVPDNLDSAAELRLAESLGDFVRSLHALDSAGTPAGEEHWGYRAGDPVTDTIDGWAVEAAQVLRDLFDPDQVASAWERIREVPPPTAPASWVHADLSAENLLVAPDGRLCGVIDFGSMGVGDASVDLLYAWSLFGPDARAAFGCAAGADDATWARARAWAFVGPGLLTLADCRGSMPARERRLTAMVETIAAEVGVRLR